jgi:hypothetical protein
MQTRYLIQILLPLYDNRGTPTPASLFREVREELTTRFGGLTAYTRAPAEGLWKEDDQHTTRDQIVIYEVMADDLDADWWAEYRGGLEERLRQDEIVMRAIELRML